MSVRQVKTCQSCGYDNQGDAARCNGCGTGFDGIFTAGYYRRWECPRCLKLSMDDNTKCLCGFKRSGSSCTTVVIVIAVLIGLAMIMSN